MIRKTFFLILLVLLFANTNGQTLNKVDESLFSELKMRNIGPAFVSGRISDIAIHPQNNNIWYVAVGSGGVWKTQNSGTTWKPIFDDQSVYSTGCITLDPSNPATVWLGTGENVGGRHMSFGDGVYKSTDGGNTWKNMGLKNSEHISKIIVHPENPDIILVAAQGPLWSAGGDRGLFKSVDGGKTWLKVLGVNKWTGVTDIVLDPTNPDWMYAATWQRHRTVAAYMGGGPGSGIYRSKDGGNTWEKQTTGLPKSNLGKIGLTVSPQNPEIVYAAVETDRRKGGVYKSTDKGSSWKKQSNAVSGATGPHYYQELYASPHVFDRLYLMDVRIQVSDDGGKTFRILKEEKKHSDNHAIAFRANDPNYLLVGTDAGIYESFDLAENWRFIPNLPLTQYYKVAVNNREPFYQIFAGTQDNGSHGGPSRTDNVHGIRNSDWFKTLGADGHQSATDPTNPDILYAESQQGVLHRVDLKTGEQLLIQPQAREGENYERYNWDAPIVVSPHNPARLYFASQRVWLSNNRGDSWIPISADLTRNLERIELPIMGKKQSWDNPWDIYAMSNYSTITSLSESAVQEGLIYAGTDDGLIQVTEDNGNNWRKIEVSSLPDVPERAFVNDIKADLHDANVVYIALDNHKEGDYAPYLYKSINKGKSWKSIKGNLPNKTLVWRLVQDHIKKELLFAATEFGIYFSVDAGEKWIKMAGTPTISFRDLAIQKRENDLVGASFGRGFFVFDDYSFLRELTAETLKQEAALFSSRNAWWYIPRTVIGDNGANQYSAKNPPFGAVFTYYLSTSYQSLKANRQKKEKALNKEGKAIEFPGWEALEAEKNQANSIIWLTVKDQKGNVIRKLKAPAKKGINRIAWDLRFANSRAITPGQTERPNRWNRGGALVIPGTYSASLSKEIEGKITTLTKPIPFEVVPLRKGTLQGASADEYRLFMVDLNSLQTDFSKVRNMMQQNLKKVKAMQLALERAAIEPGDLNTQLHDLHQALLTLDKEENGLSTKKEVGEKNQPGVGSFLRIASRGLATTYGPTKMYKENLETAKKLLDVLKAKVDLFTNETIPTLEKQLIDAGAPVILK
jgi:photosystem II stability/assembly factor-like uncharacterized protein